MPNRRGQQISTRGLRTRGTLKGGFKRSAPGGRLTFAGGGRRGRPQSPMAAGMAGTAKPRTATPKSGMEAQSGEMPLKQRASLRSPRSTSRRRRRRGYNFTKNIGL